jgi:pyruvate/2-oxoglutarate dehydrogenase complex dihydrolipoamide acyltransferase (E2) component
MIMKNFKDYLTESERTYNYRIKCVGDLPSGFYNELKSKLAQFDPMTVGELKSTPIQAKPADFPAHENEKVNSFDVVLRYPAIEPQIKQIARLLGFDPNKIIMQTSVFDDSVADEKAKVADQPESLLADTDFPAPDAKQKALSKDYSADPFDHGVLKNTYRSNFTVAGGKTPPAKTTNDLPMGDDSPMTHAEKRPRKPATGAQPSGNYK